MLFIYHVMSNKIKRLQKYNSVQSKVVLNLATKIHIKESYPHSHYFLKCSFNSLDRKATGLLEIWSLISQLEAVVLSSINTLTITEQNNQCFKT